MGRWICLTVLVSLFAMVTKAPAQASEFPGLANSRHIIDRIYAEAKRVSRRSIPDCRIAACTKADCDIFAPISTPMHRADAWLSAYAKRLEAWKTLHLELAEGHLSAANYSQEDMEILRDIQKAQDALQAFGNAIIEAVDWISLLEGYSDRLEKAVIKAHEKEFLDLALLIESHATKIESHLDRVLGAYDWIFQDTDQGTRWYFTYVRKTYDLIKTLKKLQKDYKELRRLRRAGESFKSTAFKNARARGLLRVAKLVKIVGDIWIEHDRQNRAAELDALFEQLLQENQVARGALGAAHEMRGIVERANRARAEIALAFTGAKTCARRICKASLPAKPEIKIDLASEGIVSNDGGPPRKSIHQAIEFFNSKLHEQEVALDAFTGRYQIKIDLQSRINLRSDRIAQSTSLHGLYHINKSCIPSDARFHVFRVKDEKRGRQVLKLEEIERPDGRLRFRVNEDLSGEWVDERGRRYQIAVEKEGHRDAISLTQENVPVRGRKRIYSGHSSKIPARPGTYELVLYSQEEDEFYLPTKFKIKAGAHTPATTVTLRKVPFSPEDLNPKLRREIAEALLKKVQSDRLSFKAIFTPRYESDESISLPTEFWSYKFKWSDTRKELIADSLRENLSRERVLRRPDPD